MMIKISVSFVFLVAPVVLAQYNRGGYDYRAPPPQGNTQQGHLGGTQDSLNRFIPSAGYHREDYRQHGPVQQQPHYNYQTYHTGHTGNQELYFNRYSHNFAASLLSTQSEPQTVPTGPSYNNARAPQPVITKHIYFHLPPSDDSATAAPAKAVPPKKIYNIIFITLPSQKTANAARLQQLITQQTAEDKTLIYVLVKKPEFQELQAIQPVTYKPEVFFVKYKEPRIVGLQVGDAAAAPALAGGGAELRPGLVNGHEN